MEKERSRGGKKEGWNGGYIYLGTFLVNVVERIFFGSLGLARASRVWESFEVFIVF